MLAPPAEIGTGRAQQLAAAMLKCWQLAVGCQGWLWTVMLLAVGRWWQAVQGRQLRNWLAQPPLQAALALRQAGCSLTPSWLSCFHQHSGRPPWATTLPGAACRPVLAATPAGGGWRRQSSEALPPSPRGIRQAVSCGKCCRHAALRAYRMPLPRQVNPGVCTGRLGANKTRTQSPTDGRDRAPNVAAGYCTCCTAQQALQRRALPPPQRSLSKRALQNSRGSSPSTAVPLMFFQSRCTIIAARVPSTGCPGGFS